MSRGNKYLLERKLIIKVYLNNLCKKVEWLTHLTSKPMIASCMGSNPVGFPW